MNTFATTQSASRRALRSKARKLGTPRGSIGAFAVLAIVAASAASAGAFGTFTNSATAVQSLTNGTVQITLGDNSGTGENTLTVGAGNLAAGDDVQRVVDIYNSGTLDLASLDLGVTATGDSVLYDQSNKALQIDVQGCSAAWTEHGTSAPYTYTCDSPATQSTVLSSTAATFSATDLSNVALTSGGVNHLRVTATLPAGDDEATYGGKAASLTYTFTATQRAATDQ